MAKITLDNINDLWMDINSRAAVAFGLAIVAALLTYLAFFK